MPPGLVSNDSVYCNYFGTIVVSGIAHFMVWVTFYTAMYLFKYYILVQSLCILTHKCINNDKRIPRSTGELCRSFLYHPIRIMLCILSCFRLPIYSGSWVGLWNELNPSNECYGYSISCITLIIASKEQVTVKKFTRSCYMMCIQVRYAMYSWCVDTCNKIKMDLFS